MLSFLAFSDISPAAVIACCLQATRTIDFGSLAAILVEKSSSQDEFTRLTAIKWLKEFVEMASGQLVGQYAEMIGAVLPNISHPSKEIQQVSKRGVC